MGDSATRFGLVFCLVGALGCAFAFGGRPGKKCDGDDDCRSGSQCLGGFCSGGSCTCSNSNCDCRGDWECRESSAPFSTGTCFLPCSDHDECPETWACQGGECTFSTLADAEIEGLGTYVAGETAAFTVTVSPELPGALYEWEIRPESASIVSTPPYGKTIEVEFAEPGFHRLSASVRDGERSASAQLEFQVVAP